MTTAISQQAERSRGVRAIALRAMGPVADLLERQVQRLQVRAVELVQEGAARCDQIGEGHHALTLRRLPITVKVANPHLVAQ